MKPSRANLVTAGFLLVLLAAVAFTAPRWSSALMRRLPGGEDDAETAQAEAAAAASAAEDTAAPVQRRINVKLYFQSPGGRGLAVEERPVAFASELPRQLQAVVEELVKGSQAGLVPTLAPDTRVLHVFVSARGVAYVDLSKEAAVVQPAGSEAEMMTVYSVVNSLAANFPAVQRVQILIEDRPVATLAGHVDLIRPLRPDMTLLAGEPVQPASAGTE